VPARSNLAVADTQAQVFKTKQPSFSVTHRRLGEPLVYRGCAYGSSRLVTLGEVAGRCSSSGCAPSIRGLTLAGTIVAFEYSFGSEPENAEGQSEWIVMVRDLRTGRLLHRVATGTRSPPKSGFVGVGPTTTIVVKSNGSVAWIVDTGREQGRYEVHAADPSGSRLLAADSDIGPLSLALADSTLYWTLGGKPYSATVN
jgi:hypothetical protein